MFNVQLRPEVRKELKDPDGFASGLGIVYTGLTITMAGVVMMLILYFNKPEHVLHPTWLLFIEKCSNSLVLIEKRQKQSLGFYWMPCNTVPPRIAALPWGWIELLCY